MRGRCGRVVGEKALRKISVAVLWTLLLTIAACKSNPPDLPLLDSVDQENVELVQEHIDYGTDLNESFIPEGFPFAGASALHLAVLKKNTEITTLLLGAGADIDIKSRDGFESSPLIWAAYWGVSEIVELLVESGADLEALDAFGTSALGAGGAHNPFIAVGILEQFNEHRATIKQYLRAAGAK